MRYQREYKGCQVEASAVKSEDGYICSVTLIAGDQTEHCFNLPASVEFSRWEEAAKQALQYAFDLVDGLVPSCDQNDMLGIARKA